MGNDPDWSVVETNLSAARLRHYLIAVGGDRTRAIALYEWNIAISAAFWESFSYFEVALRNTIDRQLSARHARLTRPGHWIFDDAHELGRDALAPGKHQQPYRDVAEAIRRVRVNRKPLEAGQIVSEISFGFWHQLLSKRHLALWPDIASGFPHAPSRDQALIREPVARLRDLRNRIGHHHRIWALDISGRYDDMLTLAGYLNPAVRDWIAVKSRVPSLLADRP